MSIIPYLNFAGNTREVLAFYADVFHTAPSAIMSFGEMPPNPAMPLPDSAKNLVANAAITISGSTVMMSDTWPGSPVTVGTNVGLLLDSKDKDEIVDRYNRLLEGGKVGMPLQETFWSKCYGSLTDKYGIEWQFNLDSEERSG